METGGTESPSSLSHTRSRISFSSPVVRFPLPKNACLLITHDNDHKTKYFELLESGNVEEAEAVRAKLPDIFGREIGAEYVQAINEQTILNGDRFVFSPFQDRRV